MKPRKKPRPFGVKTGRTGLQLAWATVDIDGEQQVIKQSFLTPGEAYLWISYWKSEENVILGVTLQKCFDHYFSKSKAGYETNKGMERVAGKLLDYFGRTTNPLAITQESVDQYVRDCVGNTSLINIAWLIRVIDMLKVKHRLFVPKFCNPSSVDGYYMYADDEFAKAFEWADDHAKAQIVLCLLTGLRPTETQRIKREHIHGNVLRIPAEIRKNKRYNHIPICDTVRKYVIDSGYIDTRHVRDHRQLADRTRKKGIADRRNGTYSGWRGLRPVRRLLVSWAEDEGFSLDKIALVTGHSRKGITARYSDAGGMLKIKGKVIAALEQLMLETIADHDTSSPLSLLSHSHLPCVGICHTPF